MDVAVKLYTEKEETYFTYERNLMKAILGEAEKAEEIRIYKNCEKVEIHLEMKHQTTDYKIDMDLYNKIEKKILKIKYYRKGTKNESDSK